MTFTPRPAPTPEVEVISEALYAQLMSVMGWKKPNLGTRLLKPLFSSPVRRMSSLVVELDRNIVRVGWNPAIRQFLSHFVTRVQIQGEGNIPSQGPLMVICNHPAAYDVAILIASIPREDLKVVASDIPIVQLLPNIAPHSIPVPYNIPARVKTVRSTIEHLKNGGSILIFPRGNVEPDPAVSPGAERSLAGWSPSLELFLRSVPQTLTVTAIASGVLSASWYRNPVVRMWKKYEQRQKVAEIFQIASQLLIRRVPSTTPLVTFSRALSVDELGGVEAPQGTLMANLTAQARILLHSHPQP